MVVSNGQALGSGPVVCQGGAINNGSSDSFTIDNPLVISDNMTLNEGDPYGSTVSGTPAPST